MEIKKLKMKAPRPPRPRNARRTATGPTRPRPDGTVARGESSRQRSIDNTDPIRIAKRKANEELVVVPSTDMRYTSELYTITKHSREDFWYCLQFGPLATALLDSRVASRRARYGLP